MKTTDSNSLIDRVKTAFRKFSDQLSGDATIVKRDDLSPQSLEDRPLASPAMDAFENDEEYLFRFDVPGATPKNTEVHFGADRTLAVYVRNERINGKGTALFGEFEQSDWYRAVTLTENADGDRATSAVKDGILTVRVPKLKAPARRLIPVKAEK